MNKAEKEALPPGSHEALKFGCKCGETDNGGGAGAGPGTNGPKFLYRIECPLHWRKVPENPGVA